jgi:UDP-glucose:(heptosyl)LPS alpha-1,3-glucosyltransferase
MNHVVLLKSRSGGQGGLEKYASRIARAFVEKGAKVSILTTGDALQSEIPVFSTKTIPWPAFVRMEQFDSFVQSWLKKNKADLVFGMDRNRFQTHFRAGNGVHAAYLESRILTEGRLKALLCQCNPLHLKILELEKAAFENPALQKLFTNSHMVRNQVLERYNTDPKKVQVIHNGVEWHEMEADFDNWPQGKTRALQKFNLNPNYFHLLFIGNGYLRKGLDRLLLALSQLKMREFHLSVIGKDNQMDLFRAKAVQLGLKDHVQFFGPSQEIRLFYQLADALIIPSFYDPFANVTVEALAMGLFVVSSKHNGGHEILTPQNGAVIEDLLSTDAMVDALQRAIQHKKNLVQARLIRESVKHLDFSHQLKILMESCG